MSTTEELSTEFAACKVLEATNPEEAASRLKTLILEGNNDVESIKVKETAVQELCEVLVKSKNTGALKGLLTELRGFFGCIPKAKTAKIVRSIIDSIAKIPGSTQVQLEVCKEQVEWARTEKRTFLRQRIELRLASLLVDTQDYAAALTLIGTEVKKLDDKLLLVDIHLLESRVHHLLLNLPKSRAALTAARSAANSIYVPMQLQGEIDMQSGTLHAEEKDFKTAYSYFFEAFEQFTQLDDPRAVHVLKYMLLSRIMLNQADEVPSIISSKAGLKYTGADVDAMRSVAKAYQDRSLQTLQDVLTQYGPQLTEDPIIKTHLNTLYETLMEQNLIRIIEPFSRVEMSHVASLIQLPLETVENKLSQMILDKKFEGTLDQGAGCVEIFDSPAAEKVYPTSLGIIESMGRVVDTLFTRSQRVVA
eukprot:gene16740-23011_t